jgi:biotin synthase-like enzyme
MQEAADIADDLLLFQSLGVDLVSITSFIPAIDTPYQRMQPGKSETYLKASAIARLLLPDAHIAISIDREMDDPVLNEKCLNAGANDFMPDLTPPQYSDLQKIFRNRSRNAEGTIERAVRIQKSIELSGRKISSGRDDSIKNSAINDV